MRNTNKQVKDYLKQIRSHLPCSRKERKQIMAGISNEVNLYLEQEPDSGTEELWARFGAPEAIAASCVEEMGISEIMKRLQQRKRILGGVLGAIALVFLCWSLWLCSEVIDYSYYVDGYYIIETSKVELLP